MSKTVEVREKLANAAFAGNLTLAKSLLTKWEDLIQQEKEEARLNKAVQSKDPRVAEIIRIYRKYFSTNCKIYNIKLKSGGRTIKLHQGLSKETLADIKTDIEQVLPDAEVLVGEHSLNYYRNTDLKTIRVRIK